MAFQVLGNIVIPDALGSAKQILKINDAGTAGEWGDTNGGIDYVIKTANYTALPDSGVITDTSGGVFTITLPASPETGALVVIADGGSSWDTNNLTVARNGSTIDGDAADLTMDVRGAKIDFVYDGTTWTFYSKAGMVSTSATYVDTEFTATASQTTFTVNYQVGRVTVYQQGLRLSDTAYTATNGTTIVLNNGATLGDLVEVVAWSTVDVANTATAAQGVLADSAIQVGDSLQASDLSGTASAINGGSITNLSSGNLVGALPVIDGSSLTGVLAVGTGCGSTGQVWTEPTRALGTSYQNNTDAAMMVSVSFRNNNDVNDTFFLGYVGAVTASVQVGKVTSNEYSIHAGQLSFIVPPNHYYSVVKSGSNTAHFTEWSELF